MQQHYVAALLRKKNWQSLAIVAFVPVSYPEEWGTKRFPHGGLPHTSVTTDAEFYPIQRHRVALNVSYPSLVLLARTNKTERNIQYIRKCLYTYVNAKLLTMGNRRES